MESGLGYARCCLWSDLADLQLVIPSEVQAKIPGHDVVFAQIAVHDHAFHVPDGGRHAPRRIGQVAPRLRPARTELAHDTGQTLRPITGSKRLAASGHSQDVDFFERRERHVVGGSRTAVPGFLLHRTRILSELGNGLLTRHRITVMPNCQRCATGHRLKLRLNGPHYPGAPT